MEKQLATEWKYTTPEVTERASDLLRKLEFYDGKFFNPETGEDMSYKVEVRHRLTEAQRKAVRIRGILKQHQTEYNGFVFAFSTESTPIEERFPNLNQSDLARLLFIGTYVSYDDGESLSKGTLKHPNGVKIEKKSLNLLMGMSRNRYAEFYDKLLNAEVLSETDGGVEMNPYVFYWGKNSGEVKGGYQYTRLFRKSVRDLYKQYNGRSIKKLGLLYLVLPYINFNFNVLSTNPSEVEAEKVIPLTIGELAEKLRYGSSKSLRRTLHDIKYEGEPVFGFVEINDRRKRKIVVNPRVVYAGNGKHLDAIKKEITEHSC